MSDDLNRDERQQADDDRFFATVNGRRPRFRNVVTTGNLLSLMGSLGALIPVFALVAAIASWKTAIEAGQTELVHSIATMNQRIDDDRTLLYTRTNEDREAIRDLKTEVQGIERAMQLLQQQSPPRR